jgi:hypothetical protein
MKNLKKFKLTPDWVLNKLPQSYLIIEDELAIVTDIELDFVLIKQALQTLGIEYEEGENTNEGIASYVIFILVDDVSQVLYEQLSELKHNKELVRKGFVRLPKKEEIFSALCIFCHGLLPEVSTINNESHRIDEILSSLSELLASKCKFFLESDGSLCYKFTDESDKSSDSEEHALLVMIGKFACFQINLEYLELRNPKWKRLNETLSKAFPEIYDAYVSLSKKFGFTVTARLVNNPCISKKKCRKYLRNTEVENLDSDLLELDENYLEEEEVKQSTGNVNEGNGFLPPIQKQKSLNSKPESNSFSVN